MALKAIDRFIANINGNRLEPDWEDQCWNWTASKRGQYGAFAAYGQRMGAHQFAYRYYVLNGKEIPEGLEVCHTCDNPLCVNPKHLWLGTHADNMQDMNSKGRRNSPKGMKHHKAKLTDDQVRQIREGIKAGKTHRELAKEFGVSNPTISYIRNGHLWSFVK